MKIKDIKVNPDNPRFIRDDKFEKLKKSIEDFPEMLKLRPIVVDEAGMVLGGNMRLKACTELGMTEVPTITAKGLTEEQKKEFIVKDNVGFGEWDWDKLANEWDMSDLEAWGLDIPGVEEASTLKAEEDGYEVPDAIQTNIMTGDLFEIGEHRVLCGDATKPADYSKLMQGDIADMVLTDPPYNVDYTGKTKDALKIDNDKKTDSQFFIFLKDFFTAAAAHARPGGGWYIWHADTEGVNFRNAMTESGILLKQCLVWVKNVFVMGRQDYQWKHEPCLYGWKEGAAHIFTPERTHSTVFEYEQDFQAMSKKDLIKTLTHMTSELPSTVIKCDKPSRNGEHPTMKPIALLGELIENSSSEGDLVLDPFGGSGSTMVTAEQLKRRCRMLELDPKYCQVILDRMMKLDPSLPIKKNGAPYAI